MKNTQAQNVKEWIDSGKDYVYIDVRTPAEFNSEHIDHFQNIPLDHRRAVLQVDVARPVANEIVNQLHVVAGIGDGNALLFTILNGTVFENEVVGALAAQPERVFHAFQLDVMIKSESISSLEIVWIPLQCQFVIAI